MKQRILAAVIALALPSLALAAPQEPSSAGAPQTVSARDKAKAAKAQNRQAKSAKPRPAKPRATKPVPDSKKAPAT